ncbi:ras-related protein Rab-38-like [Paramacrobiotus metropolitanus]|uniref:ras-related protein Rab-38-like n=1 Tax=Paramacrobiotus metropolitanus TaxID=2943436 RepID=UPI002445F01E|nr:ras-related protein Rab-38-like [Paramacrobiotus metropolitanus]
MSEVLEEFRSRLEEIKSPVLVTEPGISEQKVTISTVEPVIPAIHSVPAVAPTVNANVSKTIKDPGIAPQTQSALPPAIPSTSRGLTNGFLPNIEIPAHSSSAARNDAKRKEKLYKVLIIGDVGVGKTSIVKRYVHRFFSQQYRATIGVDFALKIINWDQNTIIRLQLWDIAGQERFGHMTRVYYKDAVGAFIVYDMSRLASFDAVSKWKKDLDIKVETPDGNPVPCVLLGNKCDQAKDSQIPEGAKMDHFLRESNFSGYFETSAKENVGIDEAVRFLLTKIIENDRPMVLEHDAERFKLETTTTVTPPPHQKKSCC